MPALPRKPAAAELGISVAMLRRLTADGTGVVTRGRSGRGSATLYDVTTIAELVPRRHGQKRNCRDRARAAQLDRGARALTLGAAIASDLSLLKAMTHLSAYGVPTQRHADLIQFLEARFNSVIDYHLSR
jgi:hypothetical protein